MPEKLKHIRSFAQKYGLWFCIGLVIAGLTIAFTLHWAASRMDTGTLDTPQYELQETDSGEIPFDLEQNKAYTADDGVVVIEPTTSEAAAKPAFNQTDDPEKIWAEDQVVTYNSFTLQEKVEQEDGSLGVLAIPKIGLSVNVFAAEEGEELEAMTHGLAHFSHTTSWDGNIGICGHNVNFDLTDGYFKDLHLLEKGDRLTYSTSLGERTYEVQTSKTIAEDDWSYLNRTPENRITMITCISGQPTKRLMVQAVEVK